MEIEDIIQHADWKRILIDLVITNKLNPWDLDLEKLAQKIRERIEQLDFRVTGDLLLAYAIILKYRVLMLEVPQDNSVEIETGQQIELVRPARKIPVSLKYLIKIIKKYIKKYKKSKNNPPKSPEPIQQVDIYNIITFDEEDFNMKLKKFLDMIENEVLFSKIPGDKLENFLSMLLLSNDGKVDFFQEKPFDDIKIVKVR
ncbi:MAG: hypothetical protein N3C61_02765 [Candidatus Micrarchaeota archaeon]|nr:hypothetical protein [Candidatus Micrarchaeota archaeon]